MDKSLKFFMHIPKTGGTTFRHILYNYYTENEVFPNQSLLKSEFSGSYPDRKEFVNIVNLKKRQSKIICGHYNYDTQSLLSSNYKTITFIRNPLNRFISHIGHLQRTNNYKDINEYFKTNWTYLLRMQSRFLGFNYQKPNWSKIDETIENISFIGINEQFDLSIKLYNNIFGAELRNLNKKNATQNKLSYEMFSYINQAEVIRHLAQEIKIYNKCLKKFNQQIKQYNLSE